MSVTGSQAPDFTVEGEGCKPVGLGDFNGRKLVVYFYPKDDTTGCTKEALDFTALSEEFAAAGTAVLGISKDSVKSHEKFTGKHGRSEERRVGKECVSTCRSSASPYH